MEESIRLGRIAGIPIGLNWSLIVVFWLITWGLAGEIYPRTYPGYDAPAYWTAATITSVVFYASLLAHELGHSIVARRKGVEVQGITLWLFGGVAKLGGEATTPQAELRIAAIGPFVSLAVAAVMGIATFVLHAFDAPDLVAGVTSWLAWINLILAVFNLAPAAPLDGGRVLRAFLWMRSGDPVASAVSAARAGAVFGAVLIGLGLLEFAVGAGLGGLWFVFLGWFLRSAAKAEEAQAVVRGALEGVRVGDVMSPDPVTGPGWYTVQAFLDEYVLRLRHSSYPVRSYEDGLAGLVTLARLRSVPPEQRATTRVADVACPMDEVVRTTPDEMLVDLLPRLAGCTDGRALVLDAHGELVGILSHTDVSRAIERAGLRSPGPTGW